MSAKFVDQHCAAEVSAAHGVLCSVSTSSLADHETDGEEGGEEGSGEQGSDSHSVRYP